MKLNCSYCGQFVALDAVHYVDRMSTDGFPAEADLICGRCLLRTSERPTDAEELKELRRESRFFRSLLQSHSVKMNGMSNYRFRGGWLVSQLKGRTINEAVKNAVQARLTAMEEEESQVTEMNDAG